MNIEVQKANIENLFTTKTASHVCKLLEEYGFQTIFGRSDVQKIKAYADSLGMSMNKLLLTALEEYQKNHGGNANE